MHPQSPYPFCTYTARAPYEERWRAMRLRMEYNEVGRPWEVLNGAQRLFGCWSQQKDSETSKASKETCAMLSYGFFECQSKRNAKSSNVTGREAVEKAYQKLVNSIIPRVGVLTPSVNANGTARTSPAEDEVRVDAGESVETEPSPALQQGAAAADEQEEEVQDPETLAQQNAEALQWVAAQIEEHSSSSAPAQANGEVEELQKALEASMKSFYNGQMDDEDESPW
mmetsp:Transcript_59169/g.141285  ORF Transcript_59169/g.141285 Transcript_59169/m.141285 type:complete len:226 (+) Transcript_59169:909-1586(+)